MTDWIVALGRRLDQVGENLRAANFSPYQPKFRELVVSRGRKVYSERYLLGQYILVEFVSFWRSIFDVKFVTGVLMSAEEDRAHPAIVRQSQVDRIRNTERRGFVPAPDQINPGDEVLIKHGAFADLRGTYLRRDSNGADCVLVHVFGRQTLSVIPFHPKGNIVAVDSDPPPAAAGARA